MQWPGLGKPLENVPCGGGSAVSAVANDASNPLVVSHMPSVAEQLRRGREAQRLDIYQVAEVTKIKTDHLRALEAGDYGVFSAPVYIRGFVRTCASMLKLDVPKVMAELESELAKDPRFHEPPPLTKRSGGALDLVTLQLSKANWRLAVAALALLVLLFVVLSWIRSSIQKRSDPLKKLGPGLYQPAGGHPGQTLPLPEPRKP